MHTHWQQSGSSLHKLRAVSSLQPLLGAGAGDSVPPGCILHAWSTRLLTSPRLWLMISTVLCCFRVPAASAANGQTQHMPEARLHEPSKTSLSPGGRLPLQHSRG